jgi:hypothetical protein
MAYQPPPPAGTSAQQNQLALWAMITGIAGIVLIWIPYIGILGLLSGIAALILGLMGNGRARTMGGTGRGQAITGIVLGAVTIGIFIIGLVFLASVIGGFS